MSTEGTVGEAGRDTAGPERLGRVGRRGWALDVALVAGSVALFVDERIVDATWPALLASSPLTLAIATTHFSQLLLVSAKLATTPFALAVAAHTLVVTAVGFATGRRLGEPAVLRLLGRLGTPAAARRGMATARRVGLPLTVVAPILSVSLLVGAADTAAVPFAAAVAASIVARIAVFTLLGHALAGPLLSVAAVVTRLQWPLVGACVAIVAVATVARRRRRSTD
ncbi:MAG TPA: hypothetical protein VFP61_16260 [Acidimicrobiales bacterium]|nr:hypothetical protein [Acidimicrobiales bacterium]